MNKIETTTRTVQALKELLLDIVRDPKDFNNNKSIISALKSQGALAKLDDKDRGIVSCSLNTQKRAAERSIENGYETIDVLRKKALNAIKSSAAINKNGNKSTQSDQKQKIKDLERDVALLEHQNIALISLVQYLKNRIRHYSTSNDATLRANVIKDIEEITAKINFANSANLINEALIDD